MLIGLVRPALAALGLALLATPDDAAAQTFDSGPYIGASAGALLFRDVEADAGPVDADAEFVPGYDLAAQLGYRFSALRVELEVEYGKADLDQLEAAGVSVDADAEFTMVRGTTSLYLDFTLLPLFTPYAGGGIGAAHIDGDSEVVDGVTVEIEDDTHLTAHGEVGLALDFLPLISIVPAYRYIWINSGDGDTDDLRAHVLRLGARLEF